jgi:hypothetical protein
MRSILVSLTAILLVATPQTASACCMFPFFGCTAGWGVPGYGYSPASYGGGNCCTSYAPSYSAGYAPYNGYSGYSGVSNGCCGSTCGSTCGSSCGGCSNCASESFSSSKPVPDPISGRDRDYDKSRDRTFDGSNNDRRTDDREPLDSFSGANDAGRSGLDSNATEWDRSRDRERNPVDSTFGPLDRRRPDATDSEFPPLRDDLGPLDGSSIRSNNRPDFSTEPESPNTDPIDHTSNKPPMNSPVDEVLPPSAPEAAATEDIDAQQKGSTDSTGTETDVKDFLPPETNTSSRQMQLSQRELRSSHFGVTQAVRLATYSRSPSSNTSEVSSSRTEEKPLRWISIPLPEGRDRL